MSTGEYYCKIWPKICDDDWQLKVTPLGHSSHVEFSLNRCLREDPRAAYSWCIGHHWFLLSKSHTAPSIFRRGMLLWSHVPTHTQKFFDHTHFLLNCLCLVKMYAYSYVTITQTAAIDYWIKVMLTSILILKAIDSTWKSKGFSSQYSLQAFKGFIWI